MKDLFRLNDDRDNNGTETSNIFSQLSQDVNIVGSNASSPNENHTTRTKKSSKNKEKEKIDDCNEQEGEETSILKSLFDAQGIHVSICLIIPKGVTWAVGPNHRDHVCN